MRFSSLLEVALLLVLLAGRVARGQPPPPELVPRYEYLPQSWDLRDVKVIPDGDDAFFQTNYVTCLVETTVQTEPKQPTLEPASTVKELAAFAVDRKRHTFKGTVQAHDADTSSVLVNETHRLVSRGRRRCLPGPEGRDAFERFLKDSIEVDRIVVVRLLDDQVGKDLPKIFDIFRKLMRQDNFSNRDLQQQQQHSRSLDTKGEMSPPPQSEAKTRAAERAALRRPAEAVLPGGGSLQWLLSPPTDSLRLLQLSPPVPPPRFDVATWRNRDIAGPPGVYGGGEEAAAERKLTIKVIEEKDKNAGKLMGPDEYGFGARRRMKPFCDRAGAAAPGVELRHRLQDSGVEEEQDEEAPRALGPFKDKHKKQLEAEVDLRKSLETAGVAVAVKEHEEEETRALGNYRDRKNKNRATDVKLLKSLEVAGAEAAAQQHEEEETRALGNYKDRKSRHRVTDMELLKSLVEVKDQGEETRALRRYRDRNIKHRAAEVDPLEAVAESQGGEHDEEDETRVLGAYRDKNTQPRAAVVTPAVADNVTDNVSTSASVAEGSDAPGAAATAGTAPEVVPEEVKADDAPKSGARWMEDLSPFPLDPTPQPPRGQHLPIKVPPKDIAQWPSHHKRHAYRLSRAAPDNNGSSVAESAARDLTTTTTTTTTPAPTRPPPPPATADEGGRAQAASRGRRTNHRPSPQATPFYFPEIMWPLPFARRGLPPAAGIPPPMYGWGPQAEPWMYARQLEAEAAEEAAATAQQADTTDGEEHGGGVTADA